MNRQLHFLKIDPVTSLRNQRLNAFLGNAYAVHGCIEALKNDAHDAGEDRLLWRLDRDKRNPATFLLVQTNFEPNAAGLTALTENPLIQRVHRKTVAPRFQERQVFHFRLRANPTKAVGCGEKGRRGKRVAVTGVAEAEAWLHRKGVFHGFDCRLHNLVEEGPMVLKKSGKKQGRSVRTMTFNSVLFEGVLQVSDPEKMTACFERGIGHGRGFGFGMLSLAKK
ncbi:type I-E CRISPR-associated protein Cas6/Cse3/CasE [Acanthopleuribacter pedis]|uniref:Type I-E CRISPR-associated protein Cas6/Cse3/CasE n=1 Tax=Acanthopleuribacter pedis TaxID=442870 RepID=A0A8J7U873_9BACT|nr:type I-E CRISPR-associated protein Cas6/Cse3/CasE [Acanthopleuribacter pedis]MBO1323263.1 type I-E CRISPR-associated protein Cas6/Cse3/CasE [Acanthopleuribacter pedis]